MLTDETGLELLRLAGDALHAANHRWLIANTRGNPRLKAEAMLDIHDAVNRIVAIAAEHDPTRNPNAEKEK